MSNKLSKICAKVNSSQIFEKKVAFLIKYYEKWAFTIYFWAHLVMYNDETNNSKG